MNLIFDVKYLIASINPDAWYWMVQIDNEFKKYACTKEGINEYKKIHTKISIGKNCTTYKLFGKLHREDGPAVISNEQQHWYYNGKRHRENGPAMIVKNDKSWWLNDELNDDSPFIIYRDGKNNGSILVTSFFFQIYLKNGGKMQNYIQNMTFPIYI